MYEDSQVAGVIVQGADDDEAAFDVDSTDYPPGPAVAFDVDDVRA